MDVGRSWRTPAKHELMRSIVGQEVGVTNRGLAAIQRLVWIDLTAGDGVIVDGVPWQQGCSPGILAAHAVESTKPVEIFLYEIKPATFDRLIDNLTEHLPGLGYEKDGECRWRAGSAATITAVNMSGKNADVSTIRRTDAVLVFNDPNAITEWAMRETFADEIGSRTWCFRSLSTLGCNVAGIKRIELDNESGDVKRERRAWFALIAAQQRALPHYRDLLLAAIERDEAQWAYLLCTSEKWRGKSEAVVNSAFRRIGRTTALAWYRQDPHPFEALKRALFLTKKEQDLMPVPEYRTYAEYLRHPKFLEVRTVVFERAGGRCERCGLRPPTEPHHLRYPPWGTFDVPENLIAICHGCHCDIHGKAS